MGRQLKRSTGQRGAVLLVSLILLLVTTIVGFSTMETSNLESKMATTREIKEQTFHATESSIEFALDDLPLISAAYVEGLKPTPVWPTDTYSFDDPDISGGVEVEFLGTANSMGYSIRKNASGVATYYYEVRGNANRANTNIASAHTQGVYVEGPSLN
jgi:type IV pilus assembly protein PilX